MGKVRIVAVMKGAATDGCNPDADGYHIDDNEALERAGGITDADRVEVQPWIEKEQRWSWVTSDPKAADLTEV